MQKPGRHLEFIVAAPVENADQGTIRDMVSTLKLHCLRTVSPVDDEGEIQPHIRMYIAGSENTVRCVRNYVQRRLNRCNFEVLDDPSDAIDEMDDDLPEDFHQRLDIRNPDLLRRDRILPFARQ